MTTTTRIPRAVRYQVLRRDNHACRYCGATAPDVKIVVDHVTPVVLGGTNEPKNLVTACQPCNAGKAATPPDAALVADVSADALRWARARELAALQLRQDGNQLKEIANSVISICLEWFTEDLQLKGPQIGWGPDDDCDPYLSVRMWIERGLEADDILTIVDDRVMPCVGWLVERKIPIWSYTSSLCWKRIRAIDDLAQEIVQSGRAG